MKIIYIALLFWWVVVPGQTLAAGGLPAPVAAALARAGVSEEDAGLYVYDLDANREIVAVNAERPFNPASAMKLLTTFAALELLGPAYKWKTQAWLDGTLENGRLHGNLVLKGFGDPRLDLESFWLFLRDLRNRGLREIEGDVLLDRSYFALERYDPGQFDNEPSRPYNVGADALLINYKTIRLQFIPDDASGTVRIFSEPALPQMLVSNQLKLGPGDCDSWPEKPSISGNVLTFTGVFPSGCGEKFRYFSLLSPDDYAQSIFRQIWAQVGGEWKGRAREAALPADATLFAVWESPSLSDVMREVNKYSINVMARQIFLSIGARGGPPATMEKARAVMGTWLESRGLMFPELVIDNGAGLSRADRISARHLGEILSAAWRSPLMPEYAASLSLTGVDGTMRKRLNGSPAAGQSHVKTGYVDGARALAGYARDMNGRMVAVVLLINHPEARGAQDAQDALLEWMYSTTAR